MLQHDLDQLRSADPEVRRKAIIALGRRKDPAALDPLAEVYRSDPDTGLRELAYKAGRYIRSSSAEAASPTPAGSSALKSTAEIQTQRPRRQVSGMAMEQARAYFDQALDSQVRGQEVKAVELLGRALETNPELRNDTMTINLAIELTGLGSSAALATLEDPVSRREFIQRLSGIDVTTQSRRVARMNEEEVTWGSALIDLAIYGLVNGAIVFVTSLVATQVLFGLFSSAMATAPTSTPGTIALLSSLNTQQVTLPLAALYGIFTAFAAIISLLIVDGAIHLIATTVLGGEGTLTSLIRQTTLYYAAVTAVSLLLNVVLTAVALNDNTTASLSVLSWLPSVVSLVMAFWAATLTGRAYQFGTAKGCVSMILGYVALGALAFCCVLTLTSALAPTLQTLPR